MFCSSDSKILIYTKEVLGIDFSFKINLPGVTDPCDSKKSAVILSDVSLLKRVVLEIFKLVILQLRESPSIKQTLYPEGISPLYFFHTYLA